jgi:hypothetical protein
MNICPVYSIKQLKKKRKKGLQHSGALGADKAADGHVDVSGAPLVAVEAHLVLGTRCLDIPKIKTKSFVTVPLKKKIITIFIASKHEDLQCKKFKFSGSVKNTGPLEFFSLSAKKCMWICEEKSV